MLTRRENLLIRPWQERRYIYHREKVQTAIPAIDNTPPPKRPHVSCKLKKIQKEAERCSQIVSDNFTLLQHLSNIMSTTRVDHFWEDLPPNFLQRVGIYKIRSKKPKVTKPSDELYGRPVTRKERCYGCSPERYQKEDIIPEERVPFPPPKQRVTRRAITPPDWESQYKFRCAEDRPEFRGKTWKRTVKKVNIDEEKERSQRRIKRELMNGSQSIYLTKNGLTLAVKFPTRSEVLVSNRGGVQVIQREFCECKSFPKKLSRLARSKRETITLDQLGKKSEQDTFISLSEEEQKNSKEERKLELSKVFDKENSLEANSELRNTKNGDDMFWREEESSLARQNQDNLEKNSENSDGGTELKKTDKAENEIINDIADEEQSLNGTKEGFTEEEEEESRESGASGNQDSSGNGSVQEEVNEISNIQKVSTSTLEEKDNESNEVEEVTEEEKEQESAEEISTADISDPLMKENISQEDENTDDLMAIAENESKDKTSETDNEAILRALTLDTSQELWVEDTAGQAKQDPLGDVEVVEATKQELIDQEIEKMFEEAENVISEVTKDNWLEELDTDIVVSSLKELGDGEIQHKK